MTLSHEEALQRLASVTSSIRDLESYLAESKIATDRLESAHAEANRQIGLLQEEIGRLKSPPAPPPPLNPAPDITLTLEGIGTFRPQGEGTLYPLSGERSWTQDLSQEVQVRIDTLDDQIAIIIHRCWGDLPLTAPPLSTHLLITLEGKEAHNAPLRIHRQQCPPIVLNRRPLPATLPAGLPNLHPQISETLINTITLGTSYAWKSWSQLATTPFDPISESYGKVRASWTGGAHPEANEAALFSPWDSALIAALRPESTIPSAAKQALYQTVMETCDTSGNYPIHFFNPQTGEPYKPQDSSSLPLLNAEAIPPLTTAAGTRLPVPDIAHDHGIPNLAGLLTRERRYIEEMKSWVLLGPLTRQGTLRTSGIYWSGQVRATAWWLRNLFYLCLVLEGDEKKEWESLLRANLDSMTARFTIPDQSANYRENGIVSVAPYKYGEATRFFRDGTTQMVQTTFAYHLITVLREIRAAGYEEAEPMLRHLLRGVRTVWEICATAKNLSRHLACWPIVAYPATTTGPIITDPDWPAILSSTFAKLPAPPSSFSEVKLTDFYVGAWRSTLVAAIELGRAENPWAVEALTWVDAEMKRLGRQLPLSWAVQPRKED